MCSLAVSDDYCVCAYRVGINVKIAVREKGDTSWTQVGVTLPSDSKDGTGFFGIAECNGKFGFAIERYGSSTDEYSDKTYVVLSDAPLDSGSWQYSMITKTNDISGNKFFGYKFSSANGKWFLSAIRQETGSSFSGDVELHVANGSETSFTKIKTPVKSVVMKRYSASEVVFLSGKYYFLGTYYSQFGNILWTSVDCLFFRKSHKLGFFYCYRREQTGNYPRKLRICIGINITGCNANRSLDNVQPK